MTVLDDFRATLPQRDPAACWEWPHAKVAGYGVAAVGNGVARRVHRIVYEQIVGPIPDGLDLDHLCRNRACANPAHLEPVTKTINTRRAWAHRVAPGVPTDRAERHAAFRADANDSRHGSVNGYTNMACRCERCKAAMRGRRIVIPTRALAELGLEETAA